MNKNSLTQQRGSTLMEVLIAVTIISTVTTALMAMLAMSVKLAESNEKHQLALLKANETTEYLRKERLLDSWTVFSANFTNGTYCLNDLPADSADLADSIGACQDDDYFMAAAYLFQRELLINGNGSDTITMQVRIKWEDGGKEKDLTTSQEFREY